MLSIKISLKNCLEEIARLGPTYVVNECGYEWKAQELLAWLSISFPHELNWLVSFLRPDRHGDGAIYEDSGYGEMTCAVPLYLVERQRVAA